MQVPSASDVYNDRNRWFGWTRVKWRDDWLSPRLWPILRDATLRAAPQDEGIPAQPHPEEPRNAWRLEGWATRGTYVQLPCMHPLARARDLSRGIGFVSAGAAFDGNPRDERIFRVQTTMVFPRGSKIVKTV